MEHKARFVASLQELLCLPLNLGVSKDAADFTQVRKGDLARAANCELGVILIDGAAVHFHLRGHIFGTGIQDNSSITASRCSRYGGRVASGSCTVDGEQEC